jgi:hypothetical protein
MLLSAEIVLQTDMHVQMANTCKVPGRIPLLQRLSRLPLLSLHLEVTVSGCMIKPKKPTHPYRLRQQAHCRKTKPFGLHV